MRLLLVRNVFTNTLDPALLSPATSKVVPNYADTTFADEGDFPILSPRLSPDGTRTALGSRQVWAARRNMSSPPRITQVGTQSVNDTTSKVAINAQQGQTTTVVVTATDSESDPITCAAFFLQDGMSFDPATCTLAWVPSAPVGTKFYVKFQASTNTWPKASGGTDAILAEFTVTAPGLLSAGRVGPEEASTVKSADGANPTRGRFTLTTPFAPGVTANVAIFDLSGRRLAVLKGPSGSPLVWEGRDDGGSLVPTGVYLYRMEAGRYRYEGKIVVVR